MWKQWKKKISNFIFEEIEEEAEKTVPRTEKKNSGDELEERDLQTRIAYEYPKEQASSFRFPLIPDEERQESSDVTNIWSRSENLRNVDRREQLDETWGNQSSRTQRKRLQRKNKSNDLSDKSLRQHQQSRTLKKEIENIPAYIRRQEKKDRELPSDFPSPNRADNVLDERKTVKQKDVRVVYSRPHELDRAFAKKYRRKPVDVNEKTNELERNENPVYERPIIDERHDAESLPDEAMNTNEQYKRKIIDGISELEMIFDKQLNQWDTESRENEPSTITEKPTVRTEENELEVASTLEDYHVLEEDLNVPNHLLNDPIMEQDDDAVWLMEQQELLEQTLEHFNIDAEIVQVTQGPSVTRIEVKPALGVKVSRIRNLADDIKLNLTAKDIRIEAPIPGKNTVGIEVPNRTPKVVHFQEMIDSEPFKASTSPLTIALGMTIEGDPYITNIDKMPHGLIAGATGSGKSVCVNTIILSLLYKSHYDHVKLLLIDPKMVELTPYNGIPHLLAPVITDVKAATAALKWAVEEMENRYEKLVQQGVRNINSYNEKVTDKSERLPYIVIIIDELADLMMVSPQEVEDSICRIVQKARAAGIHLLLATQRSSVDVITGLIKANIPTRIAFSVSSQVDSRTIIDMNGAERLLGKGDMLFIENGAPKALRLQGPFVSDEEIDRVVRYLRSVAEPNYLFEQEQLILELENEAEDELFPEAVAYVIEQNQASTSMLQRRFRIGYNRAARLIDTLNEKGIISGQNGSKPREVLISKSQWEDLQ